MKRPDTKARWVGATRQSEDDGWTEGDAIIFQGDGNIFQFGARFGRKRCAASAQRPLCSPDRCRLLCLLSAHRLPC